MKLAARIKLVSQLLDLPIVDKDERSSGIVDDIEFDGQAGEEMKVVALLVGPGAYERRLPAWMYWLVRKIAGQSMVRVPPSKIIEIGSVVKLSCRAEELKLHEAEDEARRWIPRWGAL